MRAGTIILGGRCFGPVGMDMKRGTILTRNELPLGDTFSKGGVATQPAISMLLRWLSGVCEKYEIELQQTNAKKYQMWNGDVLCGGRGEVFLSAD